MEDFFSNRPEPFDKLSLFSEYKRAHVESEIHLIQREYKRLSSKFNVDMSCNLTEEYSLIHDLRALYAGNESTANSQYFDHLLWTSLKDNRTKFFQYSKPISVNGDKDANAAIVEFYQLLQQHIPFNVDELRDILCGDWSDKRQVKEYLARLGDLGLFAKDLEWSQGY
jgi:hypothetical protein